AALTADLCHHTDQTGPKGLSLRALALYICAMRIEILFLSIVFCACGATSPKQPAPSPVPATPAAQRQPLEVQATADEAQAVLKKTTDDLRRLWLSQQAAEWDKATNITDQNEARAAEAAAQSMEYLTHAILAARRFDAIAQTLDPDVRRQLELLK